MGFSLSWFAVKGKAPGRILAEIGLRPTGVTVGYDHQERDVAAALPGEWYLVIRDRHEYEDSMLRELSQGAELVAFYIADHVMVSKAAAWRDGKEVWFVAHDAHKDVRHLETRGQLPPEFASIRERRLAEQESEAEDCDYVIEIPYETAAAVTGYEHDAALEDLRYEVLEKVGLLRKLF